MALINTQIQPSKFEAIRDRIALILAMELENQFVTFGDYELDLDVWTERGEKIDNSECPAIIVSLASGDFSSQHQGSYLGEYTYNVDIYSSKMSEDEDYGSTLSTIALHKIAGVCTKIIEDPQYKTLGFQAPSISHREVSNMIIAPPDPNDAAYVAVGRLVVKVNVVEGTDLLTALNFEGADTSVKLYNTNKGLLYSGSGYDPPIPSNQVQLLVNGEEFDIIDGGESFDLPVVDQDGNEVGQQIGNEFVVQVSGGAVNSVNGQTGDVDLDADDIDETSTRFWLTDVLKSAYNAAVTWISTNGTNILNHIASTSNPHNTTAAQVGAPSGSGTSTGTNTGDQDLTGLQGKRIAVSGNTIAVNDAAYTLTANATFADPTPVLGKGYTVYVLSGTATIDGENYGTGTFIYRFYNGTIFTTQTYQDYIPNSDTAFVIDIDRATLIGEFAAFGINPKAQYRITNAVGGTAVVRVFGITTGTIDTNAFKEGSFDGSVWVSGQMGVYNILTDTFTALPTQTDLNGKQNIPFAQALNTSIDIASVTAVTVHSKALTGLAVGDVIQVRIVGSLINNSGLARTYTHVFSLGSLSLTIVDGTNIAASATNESVHELECTIAISATNLTTISGELDRGLPSAIDTGANIAATTLRKAFNETTSNLTGSQTFAYSIFSTVTNTVQTFKLKAAIITILKSNP